MSISRRGFLSQSLAAAGAAAQTTANQSGSRPNVLYVILEDTGPNYGCYGEPLVKTPHIDRIGHGTAHLSALLACLNLLAFAIHTVCDLAEDGWRKARTTLGPRVRFFQNLQALTSYLVFSSWTELLHTLAFARPPPSPSG